MAILSSNIKNKKDRDRFIETIKCIERERNNCDFTFSKEATTMAINELREYDVFKAKSLSRASSKVVR
jgi:hypothetical protein